MMDVSKTNIERSLKKLLSECLETYNQESGLISLEYDPVTETCIAKLNVVIIEEDEYIGFDGY